MAALLSGAAVLARARAVFAADLFGAAATAPPRTRADPAGYQIYLSTNGTSWDNPVTTGPGTGPLIVVRFPPPTPATSRSSRPARPTSWWSMTEFNAYS